MELDTRSKDQPGNASVARFSGKFNERPNNEGLRMLSDEQWTFWKNNGYVVLKQIVSKENINAVENFLWEFQDMDKNDPASWYVNPANKMQMTELVGTGMVEVYNNQVLWNNRQDPKVYNAFVDIWGTEKLWVSIDRANLNPPLRPQDQFKGFIHWDIDTSLDPTPVNVQGVLAINDQMEPEMGGFQCIPELYRTFKDWAKKQPKDRNPFKPDTSGFEIEKVGLEAGDLLIWDSMLAHGIRPNHSDQVRLAQYISMVPADENNKDLREWRIRSWRDRVAPEGYPFPGDPRNWEQTKYEQADLSELGEKLLGLKSW